MSTLLTSLTVAQLKQAIALKEKIEALEQELAAVLAPAAVPTPAIEPVLAIKPVPVLRGRTPPSAAARARMRAAQKARRAREMGSFAPADSAKKEREVSDATRQRLSAIAAARWARVKASGGKAL